MAEVRHPNMEIGDLVDSASGGHARIVRLGLGARAMVLDLSPVEMPHELRLNRRVSVKERLRLQEEHPERACHLYPPLLGLRPMGPSGSSLMIVAGTPPTNVFGGTSRVTRAPAPTIAPRPTVTPARIVAPVISTAPSPIVT